jgi:hypothetical protein
MSPAPGRRRTGMSATKTETETTTGTAAPVKGPRSYFPFIEKKHGRPIEDWMAVLAAADTTKHMELVELLKSEHGIGHGHANALVAVHLDPSR